MTVAKRLSLPNPFKIKNWNGHGRLNFWATPSRFWENSYFWRCSNDSNTIFWYFQWHKKCQKSISLSIKLIPRSMNKCTYICATSEGMQSDFPWIVVYCGTIITIQLTRCTSVVLHLQHNSWDVILVSLHTEYNWWFLTTWSGLDYDWKICRVKFAFCKN